MSEGSATSRTDPSPDRTPEAGSGASARPSSGSRALAAPATAGASARISSSSRPSTSRRTAITSSDDPAREGVRLGVIAFITATSFVGLLALGAIAGRLGADPWIGAGSLDRTLSETFVTGVRLPLAMVRALYATGVDDPLFFAASMVLLIPPIAALVAARPVRAGEARATPAVINAARLGSALIIATSIGITIRLANVDRPPLLDAADGWLDLVQANAAADLISMALSILITVLVFRLPVDRWVRALAGTVTLATAIAASIAAAASGGIVDAAEQSRPLIESPNSTDPPVRLVLGTDSRNDRVVLIAGARPELVFESNEPARIVGRRSIAESLTPSE